MNFVNLGTPKPIKKTKVPITTKFGRFWKPLYNPRKWEKIKKTKHVYCACWYFTQVPPGKPVICRHAANCTSKRAHEAVSKLSSRRHILDDLTGKMSPATCEQRKAAMHPAVQGLQKLKRWSEGYPNWFMTNTADTIAVSGNYTYS